MHEKWTFTFNHSTLKNAKSNNVRINAPDTITSTERCGPRLFKTIEKQQFFKNENPKEIIKLPSNKIEHSAMF